MTTIGFVGLGAMGSRMAGRFLAAGHRVYGTNRTAGKAAGLIAAGLNWCETPGDVARSAAVIFSMVTDDDALAGIASNRDGILAGLGAGKVWVDMSTVSPEAAGTLAERVARAGANLLNAPVSGSVPSAEQGTLEIMAGGDAGVFAQVEPLLRVLGKTVIRVGTNRQALLLKLAINISLAEQMLAFSEGVLLAERGGIDRKLATEVILSSAVGSPFLKARAPLVLDLPRDAWFSLRLVQKDLRLALDAAATSGVPLPGAARADQIVTLARKMGYGERDVAALFEVISKIPLQRLRQDRPELEALAE
jgi:3-hydroxyisobutyrate dehydrogenase-like beta-hydroxyacid dehydrogenase